MSRYSNPWSGNSQFYKGKAKKLTSAENDKDYQLYCQRKKNKNNIMPYDTWVRKERIKSGMF